MEWSDSKSIHIQARFDKVAVQQNRLMLISVVAYSQDVKAIRAGLAANPNVPIRLRELTLTKDEETVAPNDVRPSGHGYRVNAHREVKKEIKKQESPSCDWAQHSAQAPGGPYLGVWC